MGSSTEVQLGRGESVQLAGYTLTYLGSEDVAEPHRQSLVATVAVKRGGRDLGTLQPRMNQYDTQREPIGTPAVRTSLTEDLYLSIMNVGPGGQTLGLLAMVNPMVGWIWIATGVMALGGLVALAPPRRSAAAASVPAGEAAGYRAAVGSTR
jgi:cytochrome c-type biogenesis protein CcmF